MNNNQIEDTDDSGKAGIARNSIRGMNDGGGEVCDVKFGSREIDSAKISIEDGSAGAVAVLNEVEKGAESPSVERVMEGGGEGGTGLQVLASAPSLTKQRAPLKLAKAYGLFLGAVTGKPFVEMRDKGNAYAFGLYSSQTDFLIREEAIERGVMLRKAEVADIKYYLEGCTAKAGMVKDIWYRVALIPDGVEVDLGDDKHTRIRITAGKVEVVSAGSVTLFYRTVATMPMAMPAEVGNISLLKNHVHMHAVPYRLLLAWISYTMATPKLAVSKFPILLLIGGEGSGKSALATLLIRLIDPSRLGVQKLHSKPKDFAVAAQNSHVVALDNLRAISPDASDTLCMASTGGSVSSRQLYTDGDQSILNLHVAVILNGIHSLVNQPDLAQRMVPLYLQTIPEDQRRSDVEMAEALATDLPFIQQGLFELIAKILEQLPSAKVLSPTRMIDFSRWLAAMELVDGAPVGAYQDVYCEALMQGQLDSLQDSVLAAAILDFARDHMVSEWAGTPAELLIELNVHATAGTQRSRDWPANAIALSKRLLPLQTGLLTQGVAVQLTRGKHRTITITNATGAATNQPKE